MAKKHRVPGITAEYVGGPAFHDENLVYQEQGLDGEVRTFYMEHPFGNRKSRRAVLNSRNHRFTKPWHDGRFNHPKQQDRYLRYLDWRNSLVQKKDENVADTSLPFESNS